MVIHCPPMGGIEEEDDGTKKEVFTLLVDHDMTLSELIEAMILCEDLNNRDIVSEKTHKALRKLKEAYVKYYYEPESYKE